MTIRTGNPYVGLRRCSSSKTFTGAAGLGASGGATTFFNVTGDVHVALLLPTCKTDLANTTAGGTVTLGVTGNTTAFIAATTTVDIDAGEFWFSATPTSNAMAVPAALKDIAITDNVIMSHVSQSTTGGSMRIDCYWLPLSANGLLSPG